MDKRHLYHLWTKVRPIRPWYFLALALVSGAVAVLALRSNNLHMAALRSAVYQADKNNGDVVKALQDLQIYVTAHMNTDLSDGPNAPYPPVQLVESYDRAVQAEGEKISGANAQIYTDAQNYCEKQNPQNHYVISRIPCVEQYIHDHNADLKLPPPISDSLFKFDFVSPWWSPDLAGWSLLVAILSFAVFIVFGVVRWWLRHATR